MKRMMKGKAPATLAFGYDIEFENVAEFAGKSSNFCSFSMNNKSKGVWIIDTRSINHMCASPSLLTNIIALTTPKLVKLPDGTT